MTFLGMKLHPNMGILVLAVTLGGCILYISTYTAISHYRMAGTDGEILLDVEYQYSVAKPSKTSEPFDLYDPVYHSSMARTSTGLSNEAACQIPFLNPWDRSLWPYLARWKRLSQKPEWKCEREEMLPVLTYVFNNTHIRIDEKIAGVFKNPNISNQCVVGFANRRGIKIKLMSKFVKLPPGDGLKIPDLEQFIVVRCGKHTPVKKKEKKPEWEYVRVHIRLVVPKGVQKVIEKQQNRPTRRLSVLYLMQDGVSHLAARRSFNATYYYLLNEQNAIPLHGYNTVGKNTLPNVIPWLTGHHVDELPSFEKKYFNNLKWPFIWKNYSAHDYITGYAEDSSYQTFNYLKRGWSKAPTDYYFESYFKVIEKMGSCYPTGEMTHQNHLKVLDEFLDLHGQNEYYFMSFINTLSHGAWEPLTRADVQYARFFKKHFDRGTFDNTLVIVGGDHGNRFGPIRKTPVGRTEERLPLQLLIFPEWFKKQFKDVFQILQYNALHALTTPFDMHETLLDVMSILNIPREVDSNYTRGMSLFRKIPLSRTCPDAGIPPTYCVCRKTTSLPTDNADVVAAVAAAVTNINKIKQPYADICETWTLDTVVNAQVAKATESMLQSKNSFVDYIVVFELKPAKARFEANVRKYSNSGNFKVEGGITRISLYGNTADCITDTGSMGPFMRNYCYCKKQTHQLSAVSKS